jgi:hypothetical protein
MLAFFHLLVTFVANLFQSRRRLEVENLFLRHQLNIAMRRAPHRLRLRTRERASVCPVLFSPTRFFGGIEQVSESIGDGNPAVGQGGQASPVSCAN